MKFFNWNNKKNEKLKNERGICFEEIIFCIENGQLLDILEHPDPKKYSKQKIYVVGIDNYAYIVPFVVKGEEIFLKTIFPSRKYRKAIFQKGILA